MLELINRLLHGYVVVPVLKVAFDTIIIITHRLYSVMNAQKIFVLGHGKLLETGTHQQLLEENGVYANLWQKQHQNRKFSTKKGLFRFLRFKQ